MSFNYFQALNYTLANEDTSLELEMLPQGVDHVWSVAGSGGRVLPLLAKSPAHVTCVDLVQEQLYLTELRVEAARVLSHTEYLAFWGYPPEPADPGQREALFKKIRLSGPAREYFEALYRHLKWETLLYEGRWEKTFAKLSRLNGKFTGAKGRALFDCKTREQHFAYLEREFPNAAWNAVLFLLGNATVFNALLYKGHFPKKNIEGSLYRFYKSAFERLFSQGPARESFFLQIVFFGRILWREGNPVECDPRVYASVQGALDKATIEYRKGNIVDEIAANRRPVDFFSFSDVPSYFSGALEKGFWQKISAGLAPGALVVVRNYLHVPRDPDLTGYETVTDRYSEAMAREKVQMYSVDVRKWGGATGRGR